ncbi:unnamed protein product [Zymoseptoria tritici ST99CH_1A5]|uniref:Nucleotide exchange factor Fes1 domain-containing protein n=3 Tax=Zymoseptoria tritici TaxID=1047171 RepID=F9XL44_ZYMTI|nr:uncharacterized protein MYCGRDRAFT_111048 [Zymoseptoria tritici IPO323]EGP83852.1 hypothetical protein MYCGRDRAFT_111048 [Zymoseptoria tritici IPO323]SMR59142.1 unnamed protein product [Zymoseptoria tritici ST99CH_1E4]SMY28350.1 unnamed protein product [Zymoseptoria tritici ST99CH_1A5]
MADQQSLNQLLQWGIENSSASQSDPSTASHPKSDLNPKLLSELLGGPSDADLMRMAMTSILDAETPLDQKLIAWENLELLIEQIDNANNMEPLGLWPPLIKQLDNDEAEMRRSAAGCVAAAVQNNVKSQEIALGHDGLVDGLVKLATEDSTQAVRKKAISALSGLVRNFQRGLDEVETKLPQDVWQRSKTGLDASDMEQVDTLIGRLRERSAARA